MDYINNEIKIKIICEKHGEFEQSPRDHLNNKGCTSCGLRGNTEDFIERSLEIHGNKYNYSLVDYTFSYEKVKIICEKHGIFEQMPKSHLSKHGCPTCKESKGEIEVSKILNGGNIEYQREYTFVDCKYKKGLPFDFYLPNEMVCIEYHGKQHYEPITHFGGEKRFNEQVDKDNIKREFCKENGIKLIEIKYDEDIKNKLEECLSI